MKTKPKSQKLERLLLSSFNPIQKKAFFIYMATVYNAVSRVVLAAPESRELLSATFLELAVGFLEKADGLDGTPKN